ncbi:MAG: hypothetical protein AB7S38_40840 [Vulcanimicrobiota bacterium]
MLDVESLLMPPWYFRTMGVNRNSSFDQALLEGFPDVRLAMELAQAMRDRQEGHEVVACPNCGGRAFLEQLDVVLPDTRRLHRAQITCQGKPDCPTRILDYPEGLSIWNADALTIRDLATTMGGGGRIPHVKVMNMPEKLPLCACGCGKRVKSEGRRLASRQCIGRYNANVKRNGARAARSASTIHTVVSDTPRTPVLLEQLISLVRLVPRSSRQEFCSQVVSLVNAEEDLGG